LEKVTPSAYVYAGIFIPNLSKWTFGKRWFLFLKTRNLPPALLLWSVKHWSEKPGRNFATNAYSNRETFPRFWVLLGPWLDSQSKLLLVCLRGSL
jgi:hypothetical protein